jgi:hypothetical protein
MGADMESQTVMPGAVTARVLHYASTIRMGRIYPCGFALSRLHVPTCNVPVTNGEKLCVIATLFTCRGAWQYRFGRRASSFTSRDSKTLT